jgi:DNA repair and recombination RAD54-like protein
VVPHAALFSRPSLESPPLLTPSHLDPLESRTMYKRTLTSNDGPPIGRASATMTLFKPFKSPSLARSIPTREQPKRKRRRVSYQERQESGSDGDSDSGKRKKKKKKRSREDGYSDSEILCDTVNINKMYPVFKPKPFEQVSLRRFTVPKMRNANGELVAVAMSGVSLGIRPQALIIPRPLHDPMAEHAIVLYDPTTDTRETDEERKERLLEEEKEARRKTLEEQMAVSGDGLYNPHKSLRDLLGGGTSVGRRKIERVPVVIDPKLTKILRPHQIEGVQVSTGFPLLLQRIY